VIAYDAFKIKFSKLRSDYSTLRNSKTQVSNPLEATFKHYVGNVNKNNAIDKK